MFLTKTMPTFSVIVPIYKVESYLDECVKSILNQTYTDFELVLIDDGSPDRCPEICDYYGSLDNRVKVIHKPNGGVTSARNAGVQNAVGDYLVFVDGDDFIGEAFLEKLNATLVKNPVDMIAFGYTDYKNDVYGEKHFNNLAVGEYTGEKLYNIYDQLLFSKIGNRLTCGAVFHYLCTKTVKRDFFWSMQKLIPKEITLGEDAAVVMLLISNCKELYVSDICEYYYRYVPSSAAHSFKENTLCSNRILYDFLCKNCDKIPKSNIDVYAVISIEMQILKAAGFYQTFALFNKFIQENVSHNFDDILNAPVKGKMPLREQLKYYVLKYRLFFLYWIYYHRKKLD